MNSDELLQTPFGEFTLRRPLNDPTGSLRAWDGADLLLLDRVAELAPEPGSRMLIVGDNFGALSVALSSFSPVIWSDSKASQHSIEGNATVAATVADAKAALRICGTAAEVVAAGPFDLVVWNVDRVTEIVADVAALFSELSVGTTVVLAAGMDKVLPPKTAQILRQIGDVETHPGRKKAHLFEVSVRKGFARFVALPPGKVHEVHVPEFRLRLTSNAGVFSADRFDTGTRLLSSFVQTLADVDASDRTVDIVDLGCGNGALGILALRAMPTAKVHFIDESARAVASARSNVESNIGAAALERSSFWHSNVFEDVGKFSVDIVLCNPPFHHGNAMDDEVAWEMFSQSRRRLRPDGELWVVGNRHLGYHESLKRVFSEVDQIESHPKFVVLVARNA